MNCDVIIAGAGPAGSYLAYLLAKQGLNITILEKEKLPRYKSCGGGLSLKTLRLLPFNIENIIEQTPETVQILYKGKLFFIRKFSRENKAGSVTMRANFDHFLVQKAVQAGAKVIENCKVLSVNEKETSVKVATTKGEFQSSYLAGADGVNSMIAKSLGLLNKRKTGTAIEAEIDVPKPQFEALKHCIIFDFGAIPGGYGWVFPKKQHCSVGVFQANPDKNGIIKNQLDQFLKSYSPTGNYQILSLRGHRIPLGGDFHTCHSKKTLLLGDAANLADPWLGEGIYYALSSAEIAAETLSNILNNGADSLEKYSDKINRQIVKKLRPARFFAHFVFRFPEMSSKVFSRSITIQNSVVDLIRGDKDFSQIRQQILLSIPKIIAETLSAKKESINGKQDCTI